MENLIIIRTKQQLRQVEEYIKDKEYLSFDTETTGLTKDAEIIGFSLSGDENTAFYVVLAEWDVLSQSLKYTDCKDNCKSILESIVNKRLIMHNAVFDCWKSELNFGVSLINSVHTDTLLLAHLLDENRPLGLKDLGSSIFGLNAKDEQKAMHDSVHTNGGKLTKDCYELYKADSELIGKYGAKDTILTFKLFNHMIPQLFEQKLDSFFFEETMPLLRGPTYELNTTGLKVDQEEIMKLKGSLEAENMELNALIQNEIHRYVRDKYPATKPANTFNIGSNNQLSWLLFEELSEYFHRLTDLGKEICEVIGLRIPYDNAAKRTFISTIKSKHGSIYAPGSINKKTGKDTKPKTIGDFWKYTQCDSDTLDLFADKYRWVKALQKLNKNNKLLDTYVEGILSKMQYGIIYPSFLQHGTTSGRYSSRSPNFQNLPRGDKRIKACIISRPGRVFVGADYSQLEPRVFASYAKDERLRDAFRSGSDFYSTVGIEVYERFDAKPLKDGDPQAFGVLYPDERLASKEGTLASTYGTTAPRLAEIIGKTKIEAQEFIDNFFEKFPNVKAFMLESHELAKNTGQVENLFGRPRRMPEARSIKRLFDKVPHERLEYNYRNLLNLAVNHRIQSTGASIMNRSAIALYKAIKELSLGNPLWKEVKMILQVHDQLVLEGPEQMGNDMSVLLQHFLENTIILPGVKLEAKPFVTNNLADQK